MLRLFIKTMQVSEARMMSNKSEKIITTPIPVFRLEGSYVKALYSAASKMKTLEQTEKDLISIKKILFKPKIIDFMQSNIMTRSAKGKLLATIGKEAGMSAAATNFLALIAENGRLNKLHKIIRLFSAVMAAERKESRCEVITAIPLDSDRRAALVDILQKYVKDKKVILKERVDEKIIGGMVVNIDDKHIDMSIAKKIQFYTDTLTQRI